MGRTHEQRTLAALVRAARNGTSGSIVICGDPGIGKSSLLMAATDEVRGVQVVRLFGYEAESSMPFSGLHRLVMALEPHLAALPEAHRRALAVAAQGQDGPAPERFLVGLGVLGLLAEAGESMPVVVAVDDSHWLDVETMDVLVFAARRLRAEAVALLFATRDGSQYEARVSGLPLLRLPGLGVEAAVSLLTRSLTEVIDPLVAAQVATATGGNPLALVDLAQELSVRRLTEAGLSDEPVPVGRHLEAHYVRRARETGSEVQLWLLVAAADSTGNLALVASAARELDLPPDAGDGAEEAGLVELGQRLTFRHHLVRAAVYNAATGPQQRRVHAALACAADQMGLAELEAWHAAKATVGTDPEVAARLDRVADRAGRRGGMASRAKVLARAAELTGPGAHRNARLVSAAEAALSAGAARFAESLLDLLDSTPLDHSQRARNRVISLRAALAMFTGDPAMVVRACAEMLAAADGFHGHDPEREQAALIRAFYYCLASERLTQGVTLPELGRRLAAGAEVKRGPVSTVLRGLSAHILGPYHEAVPVMRSAVEVLLKPSDDVDLLELGFVSVALTTALWDERTRSEGLDLVAETAREAGSLQVLDTVLWTRSLAELWGGTPARAGAFVDQVRELRRAIGYDAEHVVNAAYLAWVGAPRREVEAIVAATAASGWGGVHSSAMAALGVRDLAEGRYRDAYARLKPLVEDPYLQVTPLQYPDFVEAAVRAGHGAEAGSYVETLTEMARASGSSWAAGVAARSRALTVPDGEAEAVFQQAIELLSVSDTPVDLARAHLLYGEWLRRLKRRRDAREHLRIAADSLERCGADPFAQRARSELEATGLKVGSDRPGKGVDLTPQEATVAGLAAEGHTNAEIGATLFISVNTVDYHLRKVFQKFGISSRRQLRDRLESLSP